MKTANDHLRPKADGRERQLLAVPLTRGARLAEVDRINSLMAVISGQIIDALRDLKFGYDKADVARDAKEIATAQRVARGTCVESTPLDLG